MLKGTEEATSSNETLHLPRAGGLAGWWAEGLGGWRRGKVLSEVLHPGAPSCLGTQSTSQLVSEGVHSGDASNWADIEGKVTVPLSAAPEGPEQSTTDQVAQSIRHFLAHLSGATHWKSRCRWDHTPAPLPKLLSPLPASGGSRVPVPVEASPHSLPLVAYPLCLCLIFF